MPVSVLGLARFIDFNEEPALLPLKSVCAMALSSSRKYVKELTILTRTVNYIS